MFAGLQKVAAVAGHQLADGWEGSDDEHAVSGGSDFCCQDSFEAFTSRHHTSTMVARGGTNVGVLRICLLGLGVVYTKNGSPEIRNTASSRKVDVTLAHQPLYYQVFASVEPQKYAKALAR